MEKHGLQTVARGADCGSIWRMKTPLLRALGMRVCRLRTERGWTQEKLAEMAHVDVRHVQEIEYGECEPKLYLLMSLCESLGCDWNTFMEGICGGREACALRRHEAVHA